MKSIKKWMLDVRSEMKLNGITQEELANKLGVQRETVCKTLNGDQVMANGKERITSALDEIIVERSVKN